MRLNIKLAYILCTYIENIAFKTSLFNILGSRRPSILPVPDMFTSSSLSVSGNEDGEEGDESDDELDDDVPWRSPSEKIA